MRVHRTEFAGDTRTGLEGRKGSFSHTLRERREKGETEYEEREKSEEVCETEERREERGEKRREKRKERRGVSEGRDGTYASNTVVRGVRIRHRVEGRMRVRTWDRVCRR